MFKLSDDPIAVDQMIAAVSSDSSGAVVTFIGTTRDHNDGRHVDRLEYEAYSEMALAELSRIGAQARSRWPIAGIAITHRLGVVPVGEASVVIVVSAEHRKPAFE